MRMVQTLSASLARPWDPDLPDDVEGMKLILHMWVALFYRKPSKLLSSSRKVVEHSNPSKFVSISSSGGFLELSDDSQDCFGFETCPADSGWDPDQTPSSSLDPGPPCQGAPQPQRSPAGSRTDTDGAAGAVDSTVSSSSGELPCGDEEEEEQEPSSTSCPESLSLQEEHSRETLGVEPEGVPEESARDVSSVTASVTDASGTNAEEPAKEELPDARISPSPPEDLGCPCKSPDSPSTENPGSQTPNSSTAPWTEPPSAPQENGEQEKQQEEQREAGPGSGPGPPEDEEGAGGSGRSLEGGDGADPQPAGDSLPLEAAPGSAEPGGAPEEGEQCQEPLEHSEKEEREEEEEKKENEELEDEGSFTGPVGLVLSESSDAEMECEQNPGNSASPEQFGVPEQDPVPSPASLAPPCPDRSSPAPSGGAGAVPGGFPEEVPPNQGQLPDPWDALGTPGSEPNGAGVAEVGSPHSESSGELAVPPVPSPVRGAQPDSVTDSPGPAGATPGSEGTDRDPAPSGEPWEPARSPGSPCRPGVSLALSPDTSSVCPASPSASTDPWGAPEHRPMGSLQSPSPGSPGQRGGGDADPNPDSLGADESNQGGNGVLVEERLGSPSGNGMVELDDPVGAEDGRDSPFECTDIGDECRAEESRDVFPGMENSPGSDTTNTEMAETPPHHHLLEPEPSSSIREAISAMQELPRQQQSFPNIQGDSAPASPAAGVSSAGVSPVPGRRESVLCRLWKPGREGGAVQLFPRAAGVPSSLLTCGSVSRTRICSSFSV
ncbi:collagen alpha-1(I) chain-like [Ammospiza caudacuta]|uniref:collagen alpha-1(I) chain-like n=1 Tax=Ammospiza caudacuta TaxID=2857398 RepID=UPI00273A338A|nr:collagen alpha-1(I) chain-like [Ammospiza caudacuta]